MSTQLTFGVNPMSSSDFGKWFRAVIESTGLKQNAIAKKAEIDPVSLSRILSGTTGVAIDTARALARAVNEMTGSVVADENKAVRLAVGIDDAGDAPERSEVDRLAQELARGVWASGFDDLEDEDLREAFLEDMKSIAESMLKRRLEEQKKRSN